MTIEIEVSEFNTIMSCLRDRRNGSISSAHQASRFKVTAEKLQEKLMSQLEQYESAVGF